MIAAALAAALLAVGAFPVEAPPLAEISAPVAASAQAERLDPPSPPTAVEADQPPVPPIGSSASAGGRCTGWEPLLRHYSPGWDVARMSRIAYRESRCRPEVRNPSGATGLLQLMPAHCRWLDDALGEPCTIGRLQTADYTIRAAAALWARDGYAPWAL